MALEQSKKSQRELARAMGLSSPTVSSMLAKDEIDSIKYLKAVEELTGFRFEWIRTGSGPERVSGMVEEPAVSYLHEKLTTSKDELIHELRSRIEEMKKYQHLLEQQVASTTSWLNRLEEMGINPKEFVNLQLAFLQHLRAGLERESKAMSYRQQLERDQFITSVEKFMHKLEQEIISREEKPKEKLF
jgi:transcriptional regulator with XRE-family HTH domain